MKALLGLAKSDRERELIRYSVCKSSGISSTASRKLFGFEHMNMRGERVEEALKEAEYIQEVVDDLAHTQDKALLLTMGVDILDSDSESDSELEVFSDVGMESNKSMIENLSLTGLGDLCRWNFFEIIKEAEDKSGSEVKCGVLDLLYSRLEASDRQ